MSIGLIGKNITVPALYNNQKQGNSSLRSNYISPNQGNKACQLCLYPKSYYNISFGSTAKAVACAEDFLEKLKVHPKELIKHVIEKGTLLGEGGEGSIFTIPVAGMDKYVMKIPHYNFEEIMDFKENTFSKVDYGLGDINVGQPILELGPLTVLLKLDGDDFSFFGKLTEEEALRKRLCIASKIPQESYDKLADLIVELNNRGHSLDPEINNMFTIDDKAFCPMDLSFNSNCRDTCLEVLSSLVGSATFIANFLILENRFKPKEVKSLKTITNKCLKSCYKAKIPLLLDESENCTENDIKYLEKVLNYAKIKVDSKELLDKYNNSSKYEDFAQFIDRITQ